MSNSRIGAHSSGLRAICRAHRSDTPERAIRDACLSLLDAHGIEKPPVELKPLLRTLDISFDWSHRSSHWRQETGTASLEMSEDGLKLYVDKAQTRATWRRTRFTIAHEIVHALIFRMLDDTELIQSLDETSGATAEVERVCNVGAAELLMPSPMMRRAVDEYGLYPEGLRSLYEDFAVSQSSLIWRIASLRPSSSVIEWKKYKRHRGDDNCLRVARCYPPYQHSKDEGRPWLPNHATTRHISSCIVEDAYYEDIYEQEDDVLITKSSDKWVRNALSTHLPNKNSHEQNTFNDFDFKVYNEEKSVITFLLSSYG